MITKPGKDFHLNTLGKVYAVNILNHLQYYINNHIIPEQFGFCLNHCTTIQLVNIVDEISIIFLSINQKGKKQEQYSLILKKHLTKSGVMVYYTN